MHASTFRTLAHDALVDANRAVHDARERYGRGTAPWSRAVRRYREVLRGIREARAATEQREA